MSAASRLAVACVLVLVPFARAAALADPPAASALQEANEVEPSPTAPILLDGEVLFAVRGISAMPAEERAARISRSLREMADDPTFDPVGLKAEEIPGGLRIVAADGRWLMNVYDADSTHEGFTREGVSTALLYRLKAAVASYRAARTPEALLSATFHAAGALAALVIALLLLGWIGRRVDRGLERRFSALKPRVGIGSFDIVRAEHIWKLLTNLTRLVRWILRLTALYLALRYALGRFPWTRYLANSLDDLIIGPLQTMGGAVLTFVPDLIFLIILFFITRWFVRLAHLFFQAVERGTVKLENFEPEWANPTFRLVRLGIIAFAVVVAYPYIPGSDSAALKGVSLFLGVLISLGSSSAISNIIAGYMLTYRRAFRIGDRVRIGEVFGDVVSVRLIVTHIRTAKNESITLPNSTILGSDVINYTTLAATDGLILHLTVDIGYETPWRQVEAMLLLAAERTPGLRTDRQAFVHQLELGDFAVKYELNVYADSAQHMLAQRSALRRSVLDVFNEHGVQIMTPAYEGDPEEPKVVPPDRWFTAPAAAPDAKRAGSGDGAAKRP
jgi:small-conductance mechanosensitive channel